MDLSTNFVVIRCSLVFMYLGTSSSITYSTTEYGFTTVSSNISALSDTGCTCECDNNNVTPTHITQEQLMEEIAKIYQELLLDKDNISATLRKRISVPDHRPSARSIGYVGVLVLLMSIGSIVCLDATTLLADIKTTFGNLKYIVTKHDMNKVTYDNVEMGDVHKLD